MNTPVTGSRAARPSVADTSAVPTVAGLRSWGAVLVAVLLTGLGAVIDGMSSGGLGWGFTVGFVAGVGSAALMVRRGSIFTAIVQPPLVMVVLMFLALKVISNDALKIIGIKLVGNFPLMVVGTALALLLCVVRIFAQPMRRQKKSPMLQGAHT
ncbi:MAG: DUF6542 domain-containing protein [Nakamurella sp.]